jgi:2,4-didehydro-3-deoxy-L-rhamnonate hydrolase
VQFFRYGSPGAEQPAVRVDDVVYDLTDLTFDIDADFLGADGLRAAAAAVLSGQLPVIDVEGHRIGAPIARPGAVICIGQNYAAHAAESGSPPPIEPIVFFKHPACVVGPYDDVRIPRGSTATDWEVELCVVLGGRPRYLASVDDALQYVAGYTIANDVSERNFQRERSGGQWSKGKCCETFNPLGPFIVPAWEVADPQALGLRSFVNGEPRQASNTADMIFSVAFLIWHLSQFMVLEPGDIINTGTPEGVAMSGRFPYLQLGDAMAMEIDGLGSQRSELIRPPGA